MKQKHKVNTFLQVTAITLTAIMAVQFFVAPVNASLSTRTLKVCLILPTTGGLGVIGVDEVRGATIAIDQANTILAAGSSGIQFATPPPSADSGTTAAQADNGWKLLVNVDGCQATVGAAGSGETSGFLTDANTAKIPTISPSSTAASLAIAGDSLFRAPGNDLAQAPAAAALIYAAGVRHLAIITRQDPYGTGLRDGIKTAFLAKAGTDVANELVTTYDPTSISAAQAATDTLNGQVTTFLGSHTANTIGVAIIAFEDDGVAIFNKARTETDLPKVLWFGTDGIGGSNAFIPPNQCGSGCGTGSPAVSLFMATKANVTGSFPTSPNLAAGGTLIANLAYNGTSVPKRVGGVDSGIVNLTGTGYHSIYGLIPQPYWDYSYDAAVIQMLAILKANSYVGADIRAQIIAVANATVGATGQLDLAASGDRAKQFYIYYGYNYLAPKNGTCCFAWDFSGGHSFFNPDTGLIVGSRPTASETGQIWTSELQDLAAAATFSTVPAIANAYIALSLLFVTATAVVAVNRRKRV